MQQPPAQDDELRAFLLVLHRALRMICAHIEKRYDLGEHRDKRAA